MRFLKELLCKHNYKNIGFIPANYIYEKDGKENKLKCHVSLYECEKCGKRFYISKDKMFYTKTLLKELSLWKKHQFDFTSEYLKALMGVVDEEDNF